MGRPHGPLPPSVRALRSGERAPAPARERRGLATGERNAQAKLTAAQVATIRARHADDAGPCQLGAAYGVRRTTIGDIVAGKIWKDVPPAGQEGER